ncbi:MAG: hypothetical protein Q9191_002557 [Dirinaria sp. TL-2023a]
MVELSQRLTSLSTRPPTPPKERNQQPIDGSSPNGYFAKVPHHILLDTPNESPSSSAEYFPGSSGKGTKRVEFVPFLQYHNPLDFESKHTGRENDVRHLPPSRDCKSAKSILKDTGRSSPIAQLPSLDPINTPMMLESAILHLKSTSRSSRLDAYSALLSWISAHGDLSDAEALSNSMPSLVEFIRRDMAATVNAKVAEDTQLTVQSLKLLIFLLCTPGLAAALTDDFHCSILERSITSLETVDLPKILTTHYMQVLAKQQFNEKVMTAERATRLMTALKGLTDRHRGNSVIGLRLRIYQRLLTQAKSIMAARAEHWIDHLISGMLSTTRDIRALAITFGIDAAVTLGYTTTLSQACFDLFSRKSPEGQTVVEFVATRLNDMIKSNDDSMHVPQIWGVVTLLLRNRKHKLERWRHLKPWLMILQRCFNSNEPHVKQYALAAWNRFVFAINLSSSTSPQMIKMLRQPVVSQLSRKGSDKNSKQTKHIAQSSYCNLLYYSFRPAASHSQVDLYWDHYVNTILPESFGTTKRDTDRACEILAALLYSDQPKPWDENRANTTGFVKPDELPSIEPKWVRSRADKVLAVFGKLIRLVSEQPNNRLSSPLIQAWQNFTKALGEASKQEIKVSIETMTAIAHILNMIKMIWDEVYAQQPQPSSSALSVAVRRFRFLSEGAIANIGMIPFNEQRLLQSSQDRFEAAETPSSRSAQKSGTLSSPITHLLRLLVSGVHGDDVEDYRPIMVHLLEAATSYSSSRRSQLTVLRKLIALVLAEDATHSGAQDSLWCLLANAAESALEKPRQNDRQSDSPQYAGSEFRDVSKVLEIGVRYCSHDATLAWQRLYNTVCKALRQEIGDGGVILMCTEPLSGAIYQRASKEFNNHLLTCSASVAHNVMWSQSQQGLDKARQLLWGTSAVAHKSAAQDTYENFYALVQQQLGQAYQCFSNVQADTVIDFLRGCETLLASFLELPRSNILKVIQHGLGFWVADQNGLLAGLGSNRGEIYSMVSSDMTVGNFDPHYSQIRTLWTTSINIIQSLPHTNATLLQFHHLMTAGLMSRHRSIVNDALEFWNNTYGNAEYLEYCDALRIALVRLKSVAEVHTPAMDDDHHIEVGSSDNIAKHLTNGLQNASLPFDFVESQDREDQRSEARVQTPLKRARPTMLQGRISKASSTASRDRHVRSSSRPTQRNARVGNSKTPPKARLRHDDSQIHFAAIESSPIAFEDIESQMLTERQKDTRARQNLEAAMFPELGSSPQANILKTHPELPRLVLDANVKRGDNIEPGDQVSPTSPVINGDMEAFLGSSPTPRSSNKPIADLHLSDEPPSSPPGVSAVEAPACNDRILDEDFLSPQNQGLQNEALQQKSLPRDHLSPRSFEGGDNFEDHKNTEPGETRRETQEQRTAVTANVSEDTDMLLLSDPEIFVDAPAEPAGDRSPVHEAVTNQPVSVVPSSPEAQLTCEPYHVRAYQSGDCEKPESADLAIEREDSVSRVTDSFQSQTSQYSNDDEQIAAQLAVDMERASSQAELIGAGSPKTPDNKKRKRRASSSTTPNKRSKSKPPMQQCQVIIDKQTPMGAEEDYIIVDTRSAEATPEVPPRSVKLERSSPPGVRENLTVAQSTKKKGRLSKTESAARTATSHATAEGRSGLEPALGSLQRDKDTNGKGSASTPSSRRRSVRLIRESRKVCGEDHHPQDEGEDGPVTAAGTTTAAGGSDTPSRVQAQQDIDSGLSPGKWNYHRLVDGFRNLLGSIRHVTLRAEEEREITNVLFESVKEVQEAGRRGQRR